MTTPEVQGILALLRERPSEAEGEALREIHEKTKLSVDLAHANSNQLFALVGDIHQIADAAMRSSASDQREARPEAP